MCKRKPVFAYVRNNFNIREKPHKKNSDKVNRTPLRLEINLNSI
jgi:hypothetical protein